MSLGLNGGCARAFPTSRLGWDLNVVDRVRSEVFQAVVVDRRVDTDTDVLSGVGVVVVELIADDGVGFLGCIPLDQDLIGWDGISVKVQRLVRHWNITNTPQQNAQPEWYTLTSELTEREKNYKVLVGQVPKQLASPEDWNWKRFIILPSFKFYSLLPNKDYTSVPLIKGHTHERPSPL